MGTRYVQHNPLVVPGPNPPIIGGNNQLLNPSAFGFPDNTNTAPDAGQVGLTVLSGNQVLTAGQSLSNVQVNGKVTLSGSSGTAPTLTNVFINSTTNFALDASSWSGSNRPQITSCRILLNNNTAACSVKPGNCDFFFCNISGGNDVVDTGVSAAFYDSYIHGCQRQTGSHDDAFQSLSGSLIVSHCTVTTFFDYTNTTDDFNSVFQLGEQSGAIGTILFDTCLLDGGHYAFNANWSSTTPNVDTSHPVGNGFRGPNNFTSTTVRNCRIGNIGSFRNLGYKINSTPPSGSFNWTGNVADVTGLAI
jgi:hypothetical protein